MSESKSFVSYILHHAAGLFPENTFFVVYRETSTGKIQLMARAGARTQAELYMETFADKLAEICNSPPNGDDGADAWVSLNATGEDVGTSAMASYIGFEKKRDILLVTFRSEPGPISEREMELLTSLSNIARARFDDALLIKNLQRSIRVLKKSTDQLANTEALAALTDMTSGMAHDFNNIIGGIIGRVQLMKLKAADEALLNDLTKIESQLLEGAQTVKSLQEFGTSTTYKKPELLNFAALLTDYFNRTDQCWRNLAADKIVETHVTSLVEESWLRGSPADLTTVLDKLVENAIEHSDDNTSVEITLDETKKNYRLSVMNHGKPIDEKISARIFYPFFTTKEVRGAGLGLAIVHGIVGRHNGSSKVASATGAPTVFEIEFPKAHNGREDSDITCKGRKIGNLKILVVDDDEQIREVLSDMLAISGHMVTTCSDGFTALEEIKQTEFNLVITDLGMEGMSGLDLAGLIRQEKPEMPVALITGWGSQLNHDEVALKGIKAVIAKPFHLDEINQLVEKLAFSPA